MIRHPFHRWFHHPDEEAARWFARLLDPDCDSSERAMFERWRTSDTSNAVAYRSMEQLWTQGAEVAERPELVAAAREALRQPKRSAPVRRLVPALALAAGVALVIALALVYWPSVQSVPPVRYATATGQQQTVRLADGSTLFLDTDTAVAVSIGKTSRRVVLERGRAQFEVHHDAARPFVVDAAGGTITDVGTTFQVGIEADDVDVVLLKGKVSVATQAAGGTRTVSLTAGEQLQYDARGAIGPVQPADTAAAEGWTHGKLFVHDWSLPRLLEEMNRYDKVKLQIADPSLRAVRVSGVFKTGDQQTLLQILHEGWSIRAEKISSTRIALSRN